MARDDDDEDDRPRRRRRRDEDDEGEADDGGVGYVIPYKNVPALTAYYLGMLCLLCCFSPGLSLFTGIAAVVFGVIGIIKASKNPKAHGRVHAVVGIVLGLVQILGSPVSALAWYAALKAR